MDRSSETSHHALVAINRRDALVKSGHKSSFIRLPEASYTPTPSRPSSPDISKTETSGKLIQVSGFGMPPEVMIRIFSMLPKRTKRIVRTVCSDFEVLIGHKFLPGNLSPYLVEHFLQTSNRYASHVKEIIVPLEPDIPSIFHLFSNLEKLNFSTPNAHYFRQITPELTSSLRKVSFQGTSGLDLEGHTCPESITDVVIWGEQDIYFDEQTPDDDEEEMDTSSSEQNTVKKPSMSTVEKKLLEDFVQKLPNLKLFEVWSARHHPEVVAMSDSKTGASLETIRLMGGLMTCTMPFALSHLLTSCVNLEELVITCTPMANEPIHDLYQQNVMEVAHSKLKTLRLKYSFPRPVKFEMECLKTLILQGPQQHFIYISHCKKLKRLRVAAAPRVVASIFLRPPPLLTNLILIITTGAPPKPTAQVSSSQRSGSLPVITKSDSTGSPLSENPPNPLKDSIDDIRVKLLDDYGYQIALTSSNFSSQKSNNRGSAKSVDLNLNLHLQNLKECDLRINTSINSFPKIRQLSLDCPLLEQLTFQVHPLAVAPTDIHLMLPKLDTLSASLHPSLVTSFFPNFVGFPNLKHLFVTLQDEDIHEMAEIMKPYLQWNFNSPFPQIEEIGLSNFSIFPSLTISGNSITGLVLENMHTAPVSVLKDLDSFLPSLTHLEIKSPEIMDNQELLHPFVGQEHYDNFSEASGSLVIRSKSLISLIYRLELKNHPTLDCPNLEELFFLQQQHETPLDLHKLLKGIPNVTRAYVGVARIGGKMAVIGKQLKKMSVAFGYASSNWVIDAPCLVKLKILRILLDKEPMLVSFPRFNAPELETLVLGGVLLDEITDAKLPENLRMEVVNVDDVEATDDEGDDIDTLYAI